MVLHDYSSFQLPIYFFSLQPLSKGAGREVGNSFPPLLFFVCLTILVQSPNSAHASESGLFIKLLYLNSFLYQLRIFSNLKCISYEKLFITCKRVFIFQRERVLNIWGEIVLNGWIGLQKKIFKGCGIKNINGSFSGW